MKGRWEVRIKYDGVPLLDAKDVKDKDVKELFNTAKKKVGGW